MNTSTSPTPNPAGHSTLHAVLIGSVLGHPQSISNSTGLLQKGRQLRLLRLQIRVASNMLLRNEDIGHSALIRHLLQRVLEGGAVIYVYSINRQRLSTPAMYSPEDHRSAQRMKGG